MPERKTKALKKGHGEYLIERKERVQELFAKLKSSAKLAEKFFADPNGVAKEHGLSFSAEEMNAIVLAKGGNIDAIGEMVLNPGNIVALFNNNCSCGGGVKPVDVGRPTRGRPNG